MKSNYVIRARKLMKRFYPYIRKYHNLGKAVCIFNKENHMNVQYKQGAVRYVIMVSDYVIKWDYDCRNVKCFGGCKAEYKKYLEIKDSSYAYLFAEITPIEVKNRMFYVMPRVDVIGCEYDEDGDFYSYVTQDEYDYVTDMNIGDIHNSNWGMLNDYPILIDYACATCDAS